MTEKNRLIENITNFLSIDEEMLKNFINQEQGSSNKNIISELIHDDLIEELTSILSKLSEDELKCIHYEELELND